METCPVRANSWRQRGWGDLFILSGDGGKLLRPPAGDVTSVFIWLAVFGLVFSVALEGGGYFEGVRSQAGILVWWAILLGVATGFLPFRKPNAQSWIAIALFGLFTLWVAASLIWTESAERTGADLGRFAMLLGIFVFSVFIVRAKGTRRMISAIGTAIAAIALLALLSRLHPQWFHVTVVLAEQFPASTERLSYPLDYWNGLGILIAAGLPLVLHMATSLKSLGLRSLAVAAMPAMVLALYLTYSRTAIFVAVLGLAVFFTFTSDRLPRLLTALNAAIGSGILILIAAQQSELADGLIETSAARDQGGKLILIVVVVGAVVGLIQAGLTKVLRAQGRPGWSEVSRRTATVIWAAIGVVVALGVVGLFATGFVSDSWDDFKSPVGLEDSGSDRLQSFSGNHRYQLWQSALDQNASAPLVGEGSGTYEYWHNRGGGDDGFVRDAHSLYLETLGELGVVGFILLVSFIGLVLVGGILAVTRSSSRVRPQLAASLASLVVVAVASTADWVWELAVLPMVFLLLAGTILGSTSRRSSRGLNWPLRIATIAVAIAAVVVISVPLATNSLIDRSQREADRGDLSAALSSAQQASKVNPSSASAYIQKALVLEAQGNLDEAIVAAKKATTLEETNWRTWIILARVQALGDAPDSAALRSYRKARSLNPDSSVFN